MSGCCPSSSSDGAARFFSRNARRYRRRFRRRGLDPAQRLLADGIARAGVEGATLLEIGCGVGGLHLTLLERGASRATGIDLSPEMLRHAREFATERGLSDRTAYELGDIVALRPGPTPADVVLMDKVVCCYGEIDALLDATLGRAAKVYAVSFPRDRALTRVWFRGLSFIGSVFGWSFAPFWHDWGRMVSRIERAGFRQSFAGTTIAWSVRVFTRA
jgi:magnesium-protoporphyrin O-methyltransferase